MFQKSPGWYILLLYCAKTFFMNFKTAAVFLAKVQRRDHNPKRDKSNITLEPPQIRQTVPLRVFSFPLFFSMPIHFPLSFPFSNPVSLFHIHCLIPLPTHNSQFPSHIHFPFLLSPFFPFLYSSRFTFYSVHSPSKEMRSPQLHVPPQVVLTGSIFFLSGYWKTLTAN